MNTRNLHVSTKSTTYTSNSARNPFSIHHTIKLSNIVLQDEYRDRYRDFANSTYSRKNNNLLSRPTNYHRKLMLSL